MKLLKALPMSHTDERHPQLLADAIELALHFLCQGTGGFIKHCVLRLQVEESGKGEPLHLPWGQNIIPEEREGRGLLEEEGYSLAFT